MGKLRADEAGKESGVRSQESGVRSQESAPSTQHPAPSTQHPEGGRRSCAAGSAEGRLQAAGGTNVNPGRVLQPLPGWPVF